MACLCVSLTRQCPTCWAGKPRSHSELPWSWASPASDLEVCTNQIREDSEAEREDPHLFHPCYGDHRGPGPFSGGPGSCYGNKAGNEVEEWPFPPHSQGKGWAPAPSSGPTPAWTHSRPC